MASSVGQGLVGVRARFLLAFGTALVVLLTLLPAASPAQAVPQAREVSEYREDFPGLSRSQAEARLETQQKGAGIVNQLKRDLGADYAGVWFDNEAGEFVVPLLPGADRGSVHAELAGAKVQSHYRTSPANYSWAELQAAQESIDKRLSVQIRQGLVQTSLDPRANSVVISLAKGADRAQQREVQSLAAEEGAWIDLRQANADDLRVELRGCRTYAPRICDKPLRGGVGIGPDSNKEGFGNQGLCSMGFKATGSVYGNRFVLTAGHCTPGIDNWSSTVYASEKEEPIGAVEESTFPGGDWAKVKANGSYWDTSPWPSQVAHYWEDQERPINYEAYSYLGQYVCHSGTSTGTSCGNVLALDVTVSDGEVTIYHETKFGEDCGAAGDSGGPAFTGNTALGIYNAGDSNGNECPPGSGQKHGENGYYTEITEATDALGVSVGTRIGGAPTAATGSATNLQPYQATLGGSVNPNGVETKYRFDWGTSTNYTNQNPYPDGNAGHGTSAVGVNETIYNLQPVTTYHYRLYAHNAAGDSHGSDATFKTPPAPPKASTEGVSNVHVAEETGKATLNGKVNPGGADTDYRFEWGTVASGKFESSAPVPDGDAGKGIAYVSVPTGIEGLKGQTEYQYRLRAENSEGTVTSGVTKFTTPDWRPGVTTEGHGEAYVEEETGKIELKGKVNPRGFATDYHFEWATQEEFEAEEFNNATSSEGIGNCTCGEEVEETIEGLKGLTSYHYRLVAENTEGKTEGADKSFETPDWRPHFDFLRPRSVGREEATLTGGVLTEGFATKYHFEWGETDEYGNSIPVPDEAIGSGQEVVHVSQVLEGLQQRQTYHFRLVAENAEGTRAVGQRTFSTSTSGVVTDVNGGYPTAFFSGTSPSAKIVIAGVPFFCGSAAFGGSGAAAVFPLVPAAMELGNCTSGSPSYEDATFDSGDCVFIFRPGFETSPGHFEGTFEVGPPECGSMVFSGEPCTWSIPPQTDVLATYENEGSGDTAGVGIDINAGMESSVEGPPALCPNSFYYSSHWTVRAQDPSSASVGVHVTGLYQVAPEATTEAVTGLTSTEATLNATVTPNLLATTYQFEYGTTAGYGSKVPAPPAQAGSGEQGVAVQRAIEGLEPHTTYHYRVVATNSEGTAYGEDMTFTTPQYYPTNHLEAEGYPAILAGSQDPEDAHLLSFGSRTFECAAVDFDGEAAAATASL
ncbi:MAG TPA: S1 family peptidase, partial [Solirubrobacterales bacterium]|nr:S1 family peptidase [Solirubrobacterales bacterium]